MRTIVMLALLAATHLHAASQFEGTILSSNKTVDDAGTAQAYQMAIHVKKSMVRVEVPSIAGMPASTAIYRRDRKVTWMLDEGTRTYFEMHLNNGVPGQQGGMGNKETPAVQRTKKTKKLLGYICEQVIVIRDDVRTEVWGAHGLEDLAAVLTETLEDGQSGSSDDVIAAMGLFPLLSTTTYEGRLVDSQEVTKIERKPLDPALFEIPSGYTKQKAADRE
jgi:hypothetical protein